MEANTGHRVEDDQRQKGHQQNSVIHSVRFPRTATKQEYRTVTGVVLGVYRTVHDNMIRKFDSD